MEITQTKRQEKQVKKNKKNRKNEKRDVKRNVPQSAQETLAYRRILPDGICQIDNKRYSKTIKFYDINYLLAQNEDKSLIFENYCDFLNYFDSSISIQLSFINQSDNTEPFIDSINIKDRKSVV